MHQSPEFHFLGSIITHRISGDVSTSLLIGRIIDADITLDVENGGGPAWTTDGRDEVKGITVGVIST